MSGRLKAVGFGVLGGIIMVFMKEHGVSNWITFVAMPILVIGIYCGYSVYRQKSRINLINKYCDPDAFIERTEKQIRIMKNNKRFCNILKIDLFAGLSGRGDYEEADEIFEQIEPALLSRKTGALLLYKINSVGRSYRKEEFEEGDRIMDEEIPEILLEAMMKERKLIYFGLESLRASRLKNNGEYEKSIEIHKKLLKEDLVRKSRVNSFFNLGELYEEIGKLEEALEYYSKVVELGNKLFIVKISKEKVAEIKEKI